MRRNQKANAKSYIILTLQSLPQNTDFWPISRKIPSDDTPVRDAACLFKPNEYDPLKGQVFGVMAVGTFVFPNESSLHRSLNRFLEFWDSWLRF